MTEEFKHENKHYLMDCKVVYNCLKISFDFGKFRASDLKRILRIAQKNRISKSFLLAFSFKADRETSRKAGTPNGIPGNVKSCHRLMILIL